jgi:hypothetical protein
MSVFNIGDKVEKCAGDYNPEGVVLHIYSSQNLRRIG